MGTNYYWFEKKEERCNCCGHTPEQKKLHIGKSSAGWCFSLHAIPEENLNSLKDWIERFDNFPDSWIEDEYGEKVTKVKMLSIITCRKSSAKLETCPPGMHSASYYEVGPNNLMRHPIGYNCVDHGEGTWDIIVGNFF